MRLLHWLCPPDDPQLIHALVRVDPHEAADVELLLALLLPYEQSAGITVGLVKVGEPAPAVSEQGTAGYYRVEREGGFPPVDEWGGAARYYEVAIHR